MPCRICKKYVRRGPDKLANSLHLSCWNKKHPRLKYYGKTRSIKSWKFRYELNLHDLWLGLFWITGKEMYWGVPCMVLHVWKDEDKS